MIELYKNSMGCVYQDDAKRCLVVEFGKTIESYNLPCFSCLKKAIDKIDLEKMTSSNEADIELVAPCGTDRCYVLSLVEAYNFKDLLTGAKAMLELNRILHERLFSFEFEKSLSTSF